MSWVVLLVAAGFAGCSSQPPSAAKPGSKGGVASSPATSSTAPLSGAAGTPGAATLPSTSGATQPTAAGNPIAGSSGGVLTAPGKNSEPLNCGQVNSPFKGEGCSCTKGETAACWTGPVADRNMGACHDGLQVCEGTAEFATWGKCMGEELVCGVDAGTPPPDEDCTCVPGAIIQCSEDCSVGIICSLTATKTCLPDGTWSTCSESGAAVDAPGFQCRNMLHGCLPPVDDGSALDNTGAGELFVGDCSKQFKCGHAPPPPPPPVLPE